MALQGLLRQRIHDRGLTFHLHSVAAPKALNGHEHGDITRSGGNGHHDLT